MSKTVEIFFAIGSPWVYLGLEPIARLANQYGAELVPRPTVLITENGGIFSKDRPEPRRQYWLREIERWSVVRGKTLIMTWTISGRWFAAGAAKSLCSRG